MNDDSPSRRKADAGAPAWVMTFADLMSLLMCFFVLLLSFSEMDVLKFKQIAGSMQFAFGVQREIKAKEIPKGTSIVAKEFTPGKPDPTVVAEVKQSTQESMQRFLKVEQDGEEQMQKNIEAHAEGEGESESDASQGVSEVDLEAFLAQLKADASEIEHEFQEEIEQGLIEIETQEERIIIRVQEEGSFPSGSATIKGGFKPVMQKLADILMKINGQVIVAGHTDNIPISTARFRSNWELSAARAVSFLHHLSKANENLAQGRFLIEGHGDADPLLPNDTAENRSRNRRVEVVIVQSPEDLVKNRELLGAPEEGAEGEDQGEAQPMETGTVATDA